MSEVIKIKTAELTGKSLDWAVAKATRETMPATAQWILWDDYHPTTNWRHGGPLVDEHDVWLSDDEGAHVASCMPHVGSVVVEGNTALIAICRAIVAAKLGDEVEVPQELVPVEESAARKTLEMSDPTRQCHEEVCWWCDGTGIDRDGNTCRENNLHVF